MGRPKIEGPTKHGQIKSGNVRLQLSISKQSDNLLRQNAQLKKISRVIEALIIEKFAPNTPVQTEEKKE
jgi:hypothetical protein